MPTRTVHLSTSWPLSTSLGNGWTQAFTTVASRYWDTALVAGHYISCERGVADFLAQSDALLASSGDEDWVFVLFPNVLPTRAFARNSLALLAEEKVVAGVEGSSGELLYVAGRSREVRDFTSLLDEVASPPGFRLPEIPFGSEELVGSTGVVMRPEIIRHEPNKVLRGDEAYWGDPDEDLPVKLVADTEAELVLIRPNSRENLALSQPFSYITKSINRLGFFARELTHSAPFQGPDGEPGKSGGRVYSLDDVDVVAVTTDRWESVKWLLSSVREQIGPRVTITVVVQARKSPRWVGLSRKFHANFLYVDSDYGLSAGRNLAVAATHRPLVFLMDDDFVLDERCRIQAALDILSTNQDLSVLGGNLLDVKHFADSISDEVSQGFAMECLTGPPELTWLRLESRPRERVFVNHSDYLERCDIVDNFAIFVRKTTFDRGLKWRAELKITAEHQAFYVDALQLGDIAVARTNTLRVRNVRIQTVRYRIMRYRRSFFYLWFSLQGLNSFEIIGRLGRISDVAGDHYTMSFHPKFSWKLMAGD